ncbi:MAG: hypothetical protein E5W17_00240 [Mesorhizobium sp.]|nr:MAG: hypothetical protein E5W17_00240 [Mesorhizobium sp.]
MRLLINRPQMVKQVLSGQGVVANDLFGRFDPGYAKNIPQREVDVDQAKSLLKKAGQEGLTMELVTSPLSIGMVTMCEAFVQQASLGGVTLKLRQVDPSTYWSQIWMKAPVGMDYWAARNYLTQAADCMLPSSPYNDTFWKNDRWLKIVNEAFAEQDDAKRAELISAAQHIEHDEGGYMIWGFYNRIDGVHSKVQGLSADRSGISFNSYSFRRAWLAA